MAANWLCTRAPIKKGTLESIRLYYGYDPREAVGAHVFLQSVIDNCRLPVEAVALTPKLGKELGIATDGTNAFSKIRFAVPYLSGWHGFSIWADGADMLARVDLTELWEQRSGWHGVQVVKHDYQPTGRKYIGTELETDNASYPRKNWSSLIIFNNGHYAHQNHLTPENIAKQPGSYLHRFSWLPDDRIGELDASWNALVGEQETENAKIAHYTLGLPAFSHYANSAYAQEWRETLQRAVRGMQYPITQASER